LILDESQSVGMIGAHGRGVTEHYGCSPDDVDILVGSMATGLAAGGGFCSGSSVVVDHQRINGSAFVFSAALPALLATAASTSITILKSQPNLLTTLQSNVAIMRASLARLEQSADGPINPEAIIDVPSDPASALIHIFLLHPPATLELEEKLLQDVVDEALANGLLVTRSRRLRGQETFEPEPSLKVCVTAALQKKDMEKAASVLRHALIKVVGSTYQLSFVEHCAFTDATERRA
jgi:serine palmitoyltransferase